MKVMSITGYLNWLVTDTDPWYSCGPRDYTVSLTFKL